MFLSFLFIFVVVFFFVMFFCLFCFTIVVVGCWLVSFFVVDPVALGCVSDDC